MQIKNTILDYSLVFWMKEYKGISGLELSEKLHLDHSAVLQTLELLEKEGFGTVKKNILLYSVEISLNLSDNPLKQIKTVPITTHIFFPSKAVLAKHFEKNIHTFFKDGVYINRLRSGYSQIDLIPFELAVLAKYMTHQDKYQLNDDVTGGVLRLNSTLFQALSESEIDEIYFDKVWYGKRKLADGTLAVTAILIDLSSLPIKEQAYWHSFEIENPTWAIDDADFNAFASRAFEGNWEESKDPILDLATELQALNTTLGVCVFKNITNPFLKYPVHNTYKEFVDCQSELYKLIGPDNLTREVLTDIYFSFCNGSSEQVYYEKSKKSIGNMNILKLIIQYFDPTLLGQFTQLWDKIKEYRIEGDHKITLNHSQNSSINYVHLFRVHTEEVVITLKKFHMSIEKKLQKDDY